MSVVERNLIAGLQNFNFTRLAAWSFGCIFRLRKCMLS